MVWGTRQNTRLLVSPNNSAEYSNRCQNQRYILKPASRQGKITLVFYTDMDDSAVGAISASTFSGFGIRPPEELAGNGECRKYGPMSTRSRSCQSAFWEDLRFRAYLQTFLKTKKQNKTKTKQNKKTRELVALPEFFPLIYSNFSSGFLRHAGFGILLHQYVLLGNYLPGRYSEEIAVKFPNRPHTKDVSELMLLQRVKLTSHIFSTDLVWRRTWS